MQQGFTYALSLTHHHQDAQDLVQTAAMRVINRKGHLVNRRYFYRAIRNLFYDQVKRGKIIPFVPLDAAPEEPAPADAPSGDRLDLDTFLGHLRAEEREVLYLHVVEGWTAAELARMLKQPRNTVLSRIHRAKKSLREVAENEPPLQQEEA